MKLAKKVLACIVALALIGTLAISAFAADVALNLAPSKTTAEIGDEVVVKAGLVNAAAVANGTLALTFDEAKLEYKGVKGIIPGIQVGLQPGSSNVINGAWAGGTPNGNDNCVFFEVTFAVKAEGDAKVDLTVVDGDLSIAVGDPNDPANLTFENIDAADTSVTINCVEKTTAAPTPSSDVAPSTTAAPVASDTTKAEKETPKTGDAGIAVAAGLVVLAGAAFVASKKTK